MKEATFGMINHVQTKFWGLRFYSGQTDCGKGRKEQIIRDYTTKLFTATEISLLQKAMKISCTKRTRGL